MQIPMGTEMPGNEGLYFEILPVTEDGLTVDVRCYMGFSTPAILTATTEVGGFTATCNVLYFGYPTSFSVTPTENAVAEYSEVWDKDIFNVGMDDEITFDMNLTAPVGNVNDAAIEEIQILFGGEKAGEYTYWEVPGFGEDAPSFPAGSVNKELKLDWNSAAKEEATAKVTIEHAGFDETIIDIKANLHDRKITIKGVKDPKEIAMLGSSDRVLSYFEDYVEGKVPYTSFKVVVRTGDGQSFFSDPILIRFMPNIDNVEMDKNEIIF